MYPSLTTHGICISVQSAYIPEQSTIEPPNYVFAYKIHIKNESSQAVQLVRRHWDICEALGEKRTVDGEGIVGQQPLLLAGDEYTYVSGSVLSSPIGKMEGYYTMVVPESGDTFQVTIPPFVLEAEWMKG